MDFRIDRSGDATALGGSNFTNGSKSATTLLWYRIDTIDSLHFSNRALIELFPQAGVRHQGKNARPELRLTWVLAVLPAIRLCEPTFIFCNFGDWDYFRSESVSTYCFGEAHDGHREFFSCSNDRFTVIHSSHRGVCMLTHADFLAGA